jgi:uncharacterized membrane protein YeaQ/YmgE (transglycosylase-associated protein family)
MINFIVWIGMSALVGWAAGAMLGNKGSTSVIINVIVGILGATVGGVLFRSFGANGSNINESFSLYAMMVSLVGAIVVTAVTHLIRRGTS